MGDRVCPVCGEEYSVKFRVRTDRNHKEVFEGVVHRHDGMGYVHRESEENVAQKLDTTWEKNSPDNTSISGGIDVN